MVVFQNRLKVLQQLNLSIEVEKFEISWKGKLYKIMKDWFFFFFIKYESMS